MRRRIHETFEMTLYVFGLIGLQIQAHYKAQQEERARARRLRRAHPEGTRGTRP